MHGTRNVCHSITTRDTHKIDEGDTIYQTSEHCRTNDIVDNEKATLQALHTNALNRQEKNAVLDDSPPKSTTQKWT